MEHVQIKIENVKCGGCETTVKDALEEMGGLENIVVSASEGNVVLDYNGDEKTLEKIIGILANAGYPKAN